MEEQIVILKNEHQMYIDYYAEIVRYAYMEKDISAFEILFQAESIGDFLTRLDFVSDILNYSTSIIDSINNTQLRMEESKTEYENAVLQLSTFKDDQYDLINEQEELINSLEAIKSEITVDQNYYDILIKDSNKEAQKLAEEIKKLQQQIKDKEEYINTGWARPLPKNCITFTARQRSLPKNCMSAFLTIISRAMSNFPRLVSKEFFPCLKDFRLKILNTPSPSCA